MKGKDPQSAYEEFRANYQQAPHGEPMLPWVQLSDAEKERWTAEYNNYSGETHGEHGDPKITDHKRPRI